MNGMSKVTIKVPVITQRKTSKNIDKKKYSRPMPPAFPMLDDITMINQLNISTPPKATLDIVSDREASAMVNKKGLYPMFEVNHGGLDDVPVLMTELYDNIEEVHSDSVNFLTDMERSNSPISKEQSDDGVGVCFVVFESKFTDKIYISTDRNKHDYCVDFNKISDPKSRLNLITAGKILGKDDDGKIHITNKSGSYHRWIQAEQRDHEFNYHIGVSDNVVLNLHTI